MKPQKHGFKTSEFWFGVILAIGIYALIWTKRYPEYSSSASDGIKDLMYMWAFYAGARSYMKTKNEKPTTNPPGAPPDKLHGQIPQQTV